MSWQNYVDEQLLKTEMIKHAVICGHDGNIWAQSADFKVDGNELKTLMSKYENMEQLAQDGVVIGGVKYMYLSSTDRVIRAKKKTNGVHCMKTNQAVIVCVYEEPVVAEQAASVTEKLGEYLVSVGY